MATMAGGEYTSVKDFYRDRSIFITGGTGFMGKVLVEKLLRSCPGIKNIYLLMRPKKGQNVQERLQELLNAPLFEKLRRDSPGELSKIIPVAGDVTEPELGISANDQDMLIRSVSVVFHSAATVKFDEALKLSVTINMLGTKRLVQLCHRMRNVEALIHVSTAYCNCDRHDVAEEIYPVGKEPEQVIALTQWMDDKMVEDLTPSLIASRPNTYTFTKALAERMLQRERGSLPVAIVRPSIVLSSYREPVAGWVDNCNGPTGIIAAAGKGFFRTMLCHKDKVADLVPVDIVINLMICAAWKTATHRTDTISIYNCCTGQQNPITWKEFVDLSFKYSRLHPANDALWYPDGRCHSSIILNKLCVTLQHTLPAHILDTFARLKGSRPIMVRVQAKLSKATKCLEYFSTKQWNFRDDNVRRLGEQLSPEDREIFMFDVKQINWPSYLEHYILGIRQFILKESPDTLPAARSHITNKNNIRIDQFSREKTVATTSTDIRESLTMKQEPEDEEDCYFDESSMPSTSPPPTALLPPPPPPPAPPTSSSASSSSGRHGSVTHRVRSHARSLRAMANPSAVWAHFDLCANDPLRAQCRICGAVVVRGGANPRQCGTTNLHRHLRVHHGGRLIGRRYHVLQSTSQSNTTAKTIRIATQSLVRPHIRNIAPAPLPQQQQQQQSRQPKTLVLKTIPLKVKQVAPTTIKMPPRQTNQGLPHNVVHQQPTEVCLRWNSYHSNMQNSFPSLLDTEQFVDVTLACEGRSLKCHKMILSSCSDYLADLLRENPCQHPIILMKDLKFWEVEALVKFMYRGEVNVAHDKLPQLLNAAEALQVKGLAGPSPSQNTKPPLLIPQSKPLSSQLVVPRNIAESKENKTSSPKVSASSSPKRAQKRQQSESIEPRPFTKIRLQRPITPSSPCATVKMEPLDIPLSPTEIFSENTEDVTPSSDFEKLMSLHEEDDPGGEEVNESDERLHFCELPGPPDLNDNEDQMEFVPTDFLEQQQEIVEEPESGCNRDIIKKDSVDYASIDVGEDNEIQNAIQPLKEKKAT